MSNWKIIFLHCFCMKCWEQLWHAVFNYGSGHTVDEVKQGDYTTCTIGNSLTSDNKGTTSILLQTPGTHYFICAIIGHCGSGMKLSVKVSASSPNSTSTSPPSSTTPTTTATPVATYPTSAGGSGSGTNNPYMIPYSASSTRSIKYLIIIMVIFLNLLLLLSWLECVIQLIIQVYWLIAILVVIIYSQVRGSALCNFACLLF